MLVITPFHPGDADQALRLFRWISELEGPMSHDVLLIADSRCSSFTANEIRVTAMQSFRSVTMLSFIDHFRKWPEAPNAVFSFAARHVMQNQRVPWLFLEPDCCPLKAGWLDAIAAEYVKVGKPFMGARVEVNDIPLHMSGNAVYPVDMFAHAGAALIAGDIAFDMVGATQIIPQAHFTNLIEHAWNHPTFETRDQVEREVSKDVVLYHASKDGSLIARLRERKNNLPVASVPKDTALVPGSRVGASERDGQFICDLFLKTYPGDYPWAEYCLRSIDKFCTGFRQIVIVAPDEACPRPSTMPHKLIVVPERQQGYNWQQVIKLGADQYTDADLILFADSDTIFTRPVTPETFLRDGKPIWLMTPFEKARDDQKAAWIPVMTEWMGKPPEFEWMRRHPFMFPRWFFDDIRSFCQLQHGLTIEQYVMSRTFSEFNCAGFLAHERCHDSFAWLNTEADEIPPETTLQKWSYAGISDADKAEFEAILSGHGEQQPQGPNVDPLPAQSISGYDQTKTEGAASTAIHQHRKSEHGGRILRSVGDDCSSGDGRETRSGPISTQGDVHYGRSHEDHSQVSNPAPTFEPERAGNTPWQSKEQSIAEIKSLAERLQKFCTGGAKTRTVREELHKLGIIELTYRMKKRGGWRRKRKRA